MRMSRIGGAVASLSGVAIAVALASPTAQATPATPTPGPTLTVVASHLGNPRGLAIGAHGALYVAEAGSGGTSCFTSPVFGTQCAGLTGAIARIGPGGAVPVASGLASVAGPGGIGATGVVAVATRGSRIYAQFGGNTEGVSGIPLPADIKARILDDFGQFGVVERGTFHELNPVGDSDFAWTLAHKNLVPDQFPDSNPNGLLVSRHGVFTVDAGANTLVRLGARGTSHVVAFFGTKHGSDTDAVPTCAATGPDGSIYVGELLGGYYAPGNARVWKVEFEHGRVHKRVWARGLTAVQGCGFDRWGNFYATEFQVGGLDEGPSASPLGAVVKIARNGHRTTLGLGSLFWPSGFAAGRDGAIYVSNCSIAPSAGFGPCPNGGEVVRIG